MNSPPISSWPRRIQPRWLIGLGLLGLTLVAIPIIQSRALEQADTESVAVADPLPVETVTAAMSESYDVSRTYTGEIAALQASELGFERSGQLTAILVPEGAQALAGEPLAQLDVQNLRTQRLQIEAEKTRALAQLTELENGARSEDIAAARAAVQDLEQQIALQRTQLARREILYERGAISQEALDEFSFGEGSLQAKLNQSRSQLQELQNGTRPEQISAQQALVQQLDARLADLDVNIGKSTLNAPFGGTISEHKVDIGTVVGAGQSVIRLVENDIPEARIGLPVSAISQLTIGEEKTVTINGEQYSATLTAVLPEVDAQTRTQTVILELESRAAARVSPGQTARLNLSDRIPTEGIWLPTEALTQGIRGLWTAYVVLPDVLPEGSSEDSLEEAVSEEKDSKEATAASNQTRYRVEPQTVEVIHQEGDRVLVTGTLQPGDIVVASGSHRLVPGQIVTPKTVISVEISQPFVSN
ncbi:MAG: HlyD family efflux transporter periplasmic adaptor subunit [Cyanobacteria bacterium J06554_11]